MIEQSASVSQGLMGGRNKQLYFSCIVSLLHASTASLPTPPPPPPPSRYQQPLSFYHTYFPSALGSLLPNHAKCGNANCHLTSTNTTTLVYRHLNTNCHLTSTNTTTLVYRHLNTSYHLTSTNTTTPVYRHLNINCHLTSTNTTTLVYRHLNTNCHLTSTNTTTPVFLAP